jgi:3-oxoacyl-[acyl-carrier protein] reductase
MKRLENKIAVITGGADGNGKATSLLLPERGNGWDLDLNEQKGNEVVSQIVSKGARPNFKRKYCTVYPFENATNIVLAKYTQIDILINNAGITRDATLKKMTPQQCRM